MLFPAKQGSRWYFSVPFAATLLFIFHPLHTEVVANIKGRDEILSLFFSLAALYSILLYIRKKKILLLLVSAACFFLALLSKENALTFLLIIPMTIYFFTDSKRSAILGLSLPFLFITLLYLVIRFNVIGFIVKETAITDIMNNPFYGMSFGQKMATVIYTLGLYVKLHLIPYPLTHDYYPRVIPVMSFGDWQTIVSALLYLGLGFIAFRGFRTKNPLSYSILFFIITLSIASNLILPVGTFMNERFVYMSSLGFCIALAFLCLEKLPALFSKHNEKLRLAGRMILAAVAIFFSVITVMRIPAWKNSSTLFESDLVTSANSASENCFMGLQLYNKSLQVKDIASKRKLLNRADSLVKRSLEIYPAYMEGHQMHALLAVEEFRYDDDAGKLLDTFSDFLLHTKKPEEAELVLSWMNGQGRYNQQLLRFYHKMANLFLKDEHDIEKAGKYCKMGLQLDPGNAVLQQDLREINASGSSYNLPSGK
jgi:hypothetical protein